MSERWSLGLNLMAPCREHGSANFAGQDCRRKARGAEGRQAGAQSRAGLGEMGRNLAAVIRRPFCFVSSVLPFPSRRFSRMCSFLIRQTQFSLDGRGHGMALTMSFSGLPCPQWDLNTARAPAMRECAS